MGAVSGAALEAGGDVAGVVPYAMVAAGGEVDQSKGIHAPHIALKEKGREKVRSRMGKEYIRVKISYLSSSIKIY